MKCQTNMLRVIEHWNASHPTCITYWLYAMMTTVIMLKIVWKPIDSIEFWFPWHIEISWLKGMPAEMCRSQVKWSDLRHKTANKQKNASQPPLCRASHALNYYLNTSIWKNWKFYYLDGLYVMLCYVRLKLPRASDKTPNEMEYHRSLERKQEGRKKLHFNDFMIS